jgi:hypothetical protein
MVLLQQYRAQQSRFALLSYGDCAACMRCGICTMHYSIYRRFIIYSR